MRTRTVLIRFLDPRQHPPLDVDIAPRTVMALPLTSDRVITVDAATVVSDPGRFFCWAEIPQLRHYMPLRPAA